MNTPTHDFVTVEMRGLKAALVARAQAQRVSVSELVRSAVARDLGLSVVEGEPKSVKTLQEAGHAISVKLSIRMTAEEAAQLAAGARAAGLSRGAYLAGLVAHVPVLTAGVNRVEHIAALSVSTAELATLSRNLHLLSTQLRRGDDESSRPLRLMFDTLARDVCQHLDLASIALADLQPRRPATAEPRGRTRPATEGAPHEIAIRPPALISECVSHKVIRTEPTRLTTPRSTASSSPGATACSIRAAASSR